MTSPKTLFLCIGRPIAFHADFTPPRPPDQLHPRSARFRQARYRGTDCFPVDISARPNFHDEDGVCLWTAVIQKVRRRLPNIDPNVAAEERLEPLKLGSCWYKSDDSTPAYVRSVQGHCLRPTCEPRVLQQHRDSAWVDKCNHSNFLQYLDNTSVE